MAPPASAPARLAAERLRSSSSFSGAGSHPIKATYSGSTNFSGSTTALSTPLTVDPAIASTSTAVATSKTPTVSGEIVTFTATVTNTSGGGTPTGSVQFNDGAASLGSSLLNGSGQATITTSGLSVGSHTITADYTPSGNFSGSTGTLSGGQTVNKAATTMTITSFAPTSGNGVTGQAVTVNWAVAVTSPGTGTPTGTVTVTGGSGCSAAVATGHCDVTFATAGAQTVAASYAGDTHFTGDVSGNSGYSVAKAGTNVTIDNLNPDPPTNGTPVTVHVTVTAAAPGSGTPGGSVVVDDGNGNTCTIAALAGGAGSCDLTPTSSGPATFTATYSGDADFNGNTGMLGTTIASSTVPTTTTLASSLPTAQYGQPVGLTATVKHGGSPVTAGSVQFRLDGSARGSPVPLDGTGTAQLTLVPPPLDVGSYAISSDYGGATGFDVSSDSKTQTIQQASTTTAVTQINPNTITDGQSTTITATVTSVTTVSAGSVQFRDNGADIGTAQPVSGGTAQLTRSFSGPGPHPITAVYTGSANFAASSESPSQPLTVTAANAAPTVNADSYNSLVEDTPFTATAANGLLSNDSDPDSDPLTASKVTDPTHGSVSVNPDGSFSYTPAADYNGPDAFTYSADDGHGHAPTGTVSLTIAAVNDAPSFTAGPDQTASFGAGPQTVPGWATAISAGPGDESGQTLNFIVSTSDNTQFSALPAIDPATGALTFTPAPAGAPGTTVTVTVHLHDDGGTANAGQDTSPPQQFTITLD